MYNMRKNQIIITALVIMIVIAGYINYSSKVGDPMTDNVGDSYPVYSTNEGLNEEFALDPFAIPDVLPVNTEAVPSDVTITTDDEKDEPKEETQEEGKESAKKEEEGQPGAAIFVDSTAVSTNYFSQVKLEREQIRAKSKEDLSRLINDKDASSEAKSMAGERMLQLNDRMVKESQTEALLKAKGFEQVYVCIGESDVDVIVDKDELSQQDIAKIMDAVKRKTKMTQEHIIITPYRPES